MKKKDIRTIYKYKRAHLDFSVRNQYDLLISQRFKKIQLPAINCVHHYMPVEKQHEVKIDMIVSYLSELNHSLRRIVPVMKDGNMESVLYDPKMMLKENQWGILEPVDQIKADIKLIDCVLVPLLAFDLNGNRVGYGKGCYDRFLALCRPDTIKIGFSYFEPINEISDTDKFDIPLNYCITPERIYEFG